MAESKHEVGVRQNPEELAKQYLQLFSGTLNVLRCDKNNADVILVCDDQEFPAHKVILEAGSPYFRNMFNKYMHHSNYHDTFKRVNLEMVSSLAMNIVLDFMYLRFPLSLLSEKIEVLIDVYKASHCLLLEPLSTLCCSLISREINIKSYMKVWDLSSCDSDLQCVSEKVLNFILQNFSTVVNGDHFLDLSVDRLLKIMATTEETGRPSENVLFNAVLLWIKKDPVLRKPLIHRILTGIKFDHLSCEYLNFLVHKEQIIYEDEEILASLRKHLIPNANHEPNIVPVLDWEKNNSPPVMVDDVIVYFFGLFQAKNNEAIHCIQKVNAKTGVREKPISLPFSFHSGSACIMQKPMFYFVGGLLSDLHLSSKTHFFVYDMFINYCVTKPDLPHPVSCPFVAVDDDGIIYVCDARNYENEHPLIQYFCMDEWHVIECTVSDITVLSLYVINKDLFILCAETESRRQIYRVRKPESEHVCELFWRSCFETNLNVVLNGKWYMFCQNGLMMSCAVLDPSKESKNYNAPLHCFRRQVSDMPSLKWKLFARETSILFFSCEAVFEFYPDEWVCHLISEKVVHDLRNEICSEASRSSHLLMCVD